MKYIRITRNDVAGSYVETVRRLATCIEGELGDISNLNIGVTIMLTVIEMPEDEYAKLPEFTCVGRQVKTTGSMK